MAGGLSEADPRTVRGQGLWARRGWTPGLHRLPGPPSTRAVRPEWHPPDVLPAVAGWTGRALPTWSVRPRRVRRWADGAPAGHSLRSPPRWWPGLGFLSPLAGVPALSVTVAGAPAAAWQIGPLERELRGRCLFGPHRSEHPQASLRMGAPDGILGRHRMVAGRGSEAFHGNCHLPHAASGNTERAL